jgi:hypothetical protein
VWLLDWATSVCCERNEDDLLLEAMYSCNGGAVFRKLKACGKSDAQFGSALVTSLTRDTPVCVSYVCSLLHGNVLFKSGFPADLPEALLRIAHNATCEEAVAAASLLNSLGSEYRRDVLECCERFITSRKCQQEVCTILAGVKCAEAVRLIVQMVSNSDDFRRWGDGKHHEWEDQLSAVFEGHGAELVGCFLEILSDSNYGKPIRHAATLALGGILDQDAISTLIAVCRQNERESERYSVGLAAGNALKKTMSMHGESLATEDLCAIMELHDIRYYYPSEENMGYVGCTYSLQSLRQMAEELVEMKKAGETGRPRHF